MIVRYAPALRAADNHVLYRETVRGTAFRRGMWASLAPKPIPDQAGNGAHLHISLRDVGPGGELGPTPVFYDAGDQYGLSATGYHFIGGLLAHLPALVALTCGSSTATGGSRRRCGAAPTPSTGWTTGRRRCGSARR